MKDVPDTAGHGALMDAVYRRQRHIYDATRKFYLLGRDRLIADLAVPTGSSVLEVACGTGRNLAAIGRHYPGAALYGFDISREMLATAETTVGRRAQLAEGDATGFDAGAVFGRAGFDRVVISYALSMIPDWQAALAEGWRLTAPGGALHVVDFGSFVGLPGLVRRAQHAWLSRFHVTPRADLRPALQALPEGGADATIASVFGDYAVVARVAKPA